MLRIGSLFSGAGGLDMAVEAVFGAHVLWHSEIDPGASKVLAHHWPEVPNLGDITKIGWDNVEPVDILCGGFPCQDVSAAGKRAGIKDGTRSGLWSIFADAIEALRPPIVIIENVRGLLSAKAHRDMESDPADMGNGADRPILRAAGAVLGDLADLGYDAQWVTYAAGDIGAPHRRERVFILATGVENFTSKADAEAVIDLPSPLRAQGNADSIGKPPDSGLGSPYLLPTPEAKNSHAGPDYARMKRENSGGHDLVTAIAYHDVNVNAWGKYAPAIARWEALTRTAPAPTEPNKNGNPRLAAQFSEWMMGWPAGHVTDPAIGLSRSDQLRIVGNGVCPQQAQAAIRYLVGIAGLSPHTPAGRADVTNLLPTPCARDHKDGDSAAVHARHTPSLGAVSVYFNTDTNGNGAAE